MASEAGGDQSPRTKIFLSYSRQDIAFADRLDAALKERGFEPLIDRSEIYAFEDWWRRIQSLIAQADTVIFVLSPESVASAICGKEVAFAASLNKRFAPIVIQKVDDNLVPEALSRLNFIFFDDESKFAESFDKLSEALRTNIDWIRKHTEYGEAARRWQAERKPGGLMLRSPTLEEAEHWIASRPSGAPLPTEATLAFVTESRRGASRRRNILTGSLAAGLVIALGLAGVAFWQREIANEQRRRAETTLVLATQTANGLVFDLAEKFRNAIGVPTTTIEDILNRARKLQELLLQAGQTSQDLRKSEADALIETSTTFLALGKTESALSAANNARDIFEALLAEIPNNPGWQRGLSLSYRKIGDVQARQGNLSTALKSYQTALAIIDRLAQSNPSNARWQYDLGISNERIGDVQVEQGELPAALKSYEAKRDIISNLLKSNPNNHDWERDLWVSYEKIGEVFVAQGNVAAELKSYQAGLVIMDRLAKSNPDNGQWQEDLGNSYERIGDAEMDQGDIPAALKSYEAKQQIVLRLAHNDVGNAGWQRDLSVAYEKVGKAQLAQGNAAEAQKSYQAELAIINRLAKSDPGNSDWQEDLSIAYEKIGEAQVAQGDLPEALKSYQAELVIIERFVKSDPGDARWQYGLSVGYQKVGEVLEKQGNLPSALQSYQGSLAILDHLVKSDPSNSDWQLDLAICYSGLASIYGKMGDSANMKAALSAGRAVLAPLAAQYPSSATFKNDLAWFDKQISSLQK
jgi:tetratricopeptide (TPR) repeat protein